nr:hypothetical protein Iba_chr09aCG10230 [Ipomoea batatas]GME02853.1 hypothetical protein Iba_scaffold182CG0050 [Ipomoea batatas]GME08501.1 hypothetical protein Iba_scaffold7716CG0010 [Ipomoea batatas]GME16111.1 hypothetical protein Iba_scaffold17083CG0020 [Ipomoea batatas]
MGYSSASLFVFVCVAIMAVTPASTAQGLGVLRLNLTGALLCGNSTGPPPLVNSTVALVCRPLFNVLGVFNTTINGTINNVSITISVVPAFLQTPLSLLANRLTSLCSLSALSQICSLPGNSTTLPFVRASINASIIPGNPNTINITTGGILRPSVIP